MACPGLDPHQEGFQNTNKSLTGSPDIVSHRQTAAGSFLFGLIEQPGLFML
jgi:hypothetical protein